jgi:hypothetical protein
MIGKLGWRAARCRLRQLELASRMPQIARDQITRSKRACPALPISTQRVTWALFAPIICTLHAIPPALAVATSVVHWPQLAQRRRRRRQNCSLRPPLSPIHSNRHLRSSAVTVTLPKDAHALSRSLPHAPAAVRLRYTDSSCLSKCPVLPSSSVLVCSVLSSATPISCSLHLDWTQRSSIPPRHGLFILP